MYAWRDAGLKTCRKQEKPYSRVGEYGFSHVTPFVNLPRENSSMSHASFFPPCRSFAGGRGGHPPGWLRTARLHTLGSPPARLVLRGLPVVARRAQRTQTRPRIRIGHTPSNQRTTRLWEAVGDGRRLAAQHAPPMRVQVALADAPPLDPVALGCGRAALLLCVLGALGAASARGQFRAAGYRARGRGFRGMGDHLRTGGKWGPLGVAVRAPRVLTASALIGARWPRFGVVLPFAMWYLPGSESGEEVAKVWRSGATFPYG